MNYEIIIFVVNSNLKCVWVSFHSTMNFSYILKINKEVNIIMNDQGSSNSFSHVCYNSETHYIQIHACFLLLHEKIIFSLSDYRNIILTDQKIKKRKYFHDNMKKTERITQIHKRYIYCHMLLFIYNNSTFYKMIFVFLRCIRIVRYYLLIEMALP